MLSPSDLIQRSNSSNIHNGKHTTVGVGIGVGVGVCVGVVVLLPGTFLQMEYACLGVGHSIFAVFCCCAASLLLIRAALALNGLMIGLHLMFPSPPTNTNTTLKVLTDSFYPASYQHP